MREHIPDESVDLIYLDPPFNSNATYNVLFREHDSSESAAPPANVAPRAAPKECCSPRHSGRKARIWCSFASPTP